MSYEENRMQDLIEAGIQNQEEMWEYHQENRLPSFDDMGYDPDETPRRIVIPTEPGESIEVKYITDTQNVQVCQS